MFVKQIYLLIFNTVKFITIHLSCKNEQYTCLHYGKTPQGQQLVGSLQSFTAEGPHSVADRK